MMTTQVKPIPEGYHTITPYLIVADVTAAFEFYKIAFGASVLDSFAGPDGKIVHAELKLGDSPFMIGGTCEKMQARDPNAYGGSPVGIILYVEDADASFNRAVGAGAKVLRPLTDQFYGDRSGTVTDPFGHNWTISTRKENVSPEEMRKRIQAMPSA